MSVAMTSKLLEGLALQWEEDALVRRPARETGRLVRWPTPETVGLASMNLGLIW